MSDQFIGAGIAFPLRTDSTANVALVRRDREIAEAIRLILGTSPGERPMRPEFGCPIDEFVFAPSDATTAGLLAHEVRRSLERWEPRIFVDDVGVGFDEEDQTVLYVDIAYTIKDTNDRRNLVFPFYIIPEEETVGAGASGEES